jgi:2-methylfumaryl-CoA hydratase
MPAATSRTGNFFEDFAVGQVLRHPTPRTVTAAEQALYTALYGERRALSSADTVARAFGHPQAPLPDWLVFHTVFGKTVGQVSLNAVANLGYADGRFLAPVYPGATLRAESEVIGKKPLSSGKAGVVWVRTRGLADDGQGEREVLRYCRWVMVEKRNPEAAGGDTTVPTLPEAVPAGELIVPGPLHARARDAWSWAFHDAPRWEDYTVGDRLDHLDGMTIDEADHTLATRLWQNTARVHFDAHAMAGSRFGKRLVYGGHVISIAWALAENGLGGALAVLALNGGAHVAPSFAGDTIYAWSEILDRQPLAGRDDLGALRVKLCACKNVDPRGGAVMARVAGDGGKSTPHPALVLELDVWLAVAR